MKFKPGDVVRCNDETLQQMLPADRSSSSSERYVIVCQSQLMHIVGGDHRRGWVYPENYDLIEHIPVEELLASSNTFLRDLGLEIRERNKV